jgi:predicted Zn-dependent protease
MLIEHGQETQPVHEMILSGNYRDSLLRLDATGCENNRWGPWMLPPLRLRDMTIAGL